MLSKMLVFVCPKSMILSTILSKMQFVVRIVPGLRLYFKTEILLLFQYVTYQNSLDVSNNWQ